MGFYKRIIKMKKKVHIPQGQQKDRNNIRVFFFNKINKNTPINSGKKINFYFKKTKLFYLKLKSIVQ
jgi:hypothetical protein